MPQYEYKVIKIPLNQQTYYCSFMATFGWQVQSIQESVDRVVNRSMGFSHNTNSGSMNATTYFHPHTNNAQTYGYSRNYGWGSQMNMEVQDVQSSLTVTFFRDVAIPYRSELNAVEQRFNAATPAYLQRCARGEKSDQDLWPERQAVQACADKGRALLKQGKQQTTKTTEKAPVQQVPQTSSTTSQTQPAVPIPTEPPSATIREMEVTHNVFQSNQAGIQIRLNFVITNRKDIQCRTAIYFYDEKHNALQDINQRYHSADNKVSVGSTFKPRFEESFYNDYILFMPYCELDQKDGDYQLNFTAQIYDEVTKTFLAASRSETFRYTQHGKTLRGETIETTSSKKAAERPKIPASTPRKTTPAPQSKPAAIPPRPTFKEYSTTFCKNYGWDEISEDRRVFLQGLELWYAGKYAQSLPHFKKAASLNPQEVCYWEFACDQFFYKGQYDEAIAFLQKGLNELEENPRLLSKLGSAYVFKSDPEQAEQIAERLGKHKSQYDQISYHFLLGNIAMNRKDYKRAIQCFDKADELRPPEQSTIKGTWQQYCRDQMKKQGKN